jgi:hypothetical protein
MLNSYYERTENGFKFDKELEQGHFKLVRSDNEFKIYDRDEEIATLQHNYSEKAESEEVGAEVVESLLDSEQVSEEFIEAAGGTDYLKIFISRLLDSNEK